MSQLLGLEVIAEGVETGDQVAFLNAKGYHAYQGYYFSRPLSAEDFLEYTKGAN